MTYYRKEWNLYVANFLMKEIRKDSEKTLLKESYYISVELFQFKNPEEAYNCLQEMIKEKVLDDTYREEEIIIELTCEGLHNLDLLQTNINQLKEKFSLEKAYSQDLATIALHATNADLHTLLKKKEDLSLFDEHYNYTPDEE